MYKTTIMVNGKKRVYVAKSLASLPVGANIVQIQDNVQDILDTNIHPTKPERVEAPYSRKDNQKLIVSSWG